MTSSLWVIQIPKYQLSTDETVEFLDLHKLVEWEELIHDEYARFEWIDSDSGSEDSDAESDDSDSGDDEDGNEGMDVM